MATLLRRLVTTTGVTCVAIGAVHLVLGVASVPGERSAGPTVDSRERFYAALFLGYGLAWLDAGRRTPVPAATVRGLAGLCLLGGVGRLVSIAVHGRPHWFQDVLTGVELVLPPVFLGLVDADERAGRRSRRRPWTRAELG
jgi:Domain of unknown function (DUF4345)